MLRTYKYTEDTVKALRSALKGKLWVGTEEEKSAKFHNLLTELWRVSGMTNPLPTLRVWENMEGYCRVDFRANTIYMRKHSLLSLLYSIGAYKRVEAPSVWAMGLYYKAAPLTFRHAVEDGKVAEIDADYLNRMEQGLVPDRIPPDALAQLREQHDPPAAGVPGLPASGPAVAPQPPREGTLGPLEDIRVLPEEPRTNLLPPAAPPETPGTQQTPPTTPPPAAQGDGPQAQGGAPGAS